MYKIFKFKQQFGALKFNPGTLCAPWMYQVLGGHGIWVIFQWIFHISATVHLWTLQKLIICWKINLLVKTWYQNLQTSLFWYYLMILQWKHWGIESHLGYFWKFWNVVIFIGSKGGFPKKLQTLFCQKLCNFVIINVT